VTVHEVGSRTAGLSLADDNGTEVLTGIVIDGPTDRAAAVDEAAWLASAGAVDDAGAGEDDVMVGEADVGGGVGEATGSAAFLLPACLPKRNAPTHSPISRSAPTTASVRLLDALIELTWPVI
jgi:hypothetical protein